MGLFPFLNKCKQKHNGYFLCQYIYHEQHLLSVSVLIICFIVLQPERIDPPDPMCPDYDIRADVWSLGISLVCLSAPSCLMCLFFTFQLLLYNWCFKSAVRISTENYCKI